MKTPTTFCYFALSAQENLYTLTYSIRAFGNAPHKHDHITTLVDISADAVVDKLVAIRSMDDSTITEFLTVDQQVQLFATKATAKHLNTAMRAVLADLPIATAMDITARLRGHYFAPRTEQYGGASYADPKHSTLEEKVISRTAFIENYSPHSLAITAKAW